MATLRNQHLCVSSCILLDKWFFNRIWIIFFYHIDFVHSAILYRAVLRCVWFMLFSYGIKDKNVENITLHITLNILNEELSRFTGIGTHNVRVIFWQILKIQWKKPFTDIGLYQKDCLSVCTWRKNSLIYLYCIWQISKSLECHNLRF